MPRLTVKPEAQADLRQIWLRIQQDGLARADAMLDRLLERMIQCAENPGIGRARNDLHNGLRCAVVRPYLIFYIEIEGGIDIVRVLHGARDTPSLFTPTDPPEPNA